jgi:O-methyltransferase
MASERGRSGVSVMLRRFAKHVIGLTGYELTRRQRVAPSGSPHRPDIDARDSSILERVRPYTMTSEERLLALIDAVRYLVRYDIPGAIVECGVWRGGSMMAAAIALLESGDTSRQLYLYDTFSGMTKPTDADLSFNGVSAAEQLDAAAPGTGIWCHASLEDVKVNLASIGYPEENIRFVQGKVEETIPEIIPHAIALLRLDTDWYESTRHELTHLYPKVSQGGVLIIDDYGHWKGAKLATDEYFSTTGQRILLHRIDYTGRIGLKS